MSFCVNNSLCTEIYKAFLLSNLRSLLLCVCVRLLLFGDWLHPSSNISLLCNVSQNAWPLGMEKEQEQADCIDSEHLKLRFYSAVQEGLRISPKLRCFRDCFFLEQITGQVLPCHLRSYLYPSLLLWVLHASLFLSLPYCYHARTSKHSHLSFSLILLCNGRCPLPTFTGAHTRSCFHLLLTHKQAASSTA